MEHVSARVAINSVGGIRCSTVEKDMSILLAIPYRAPGSPSSHNSITETLAFMYRRATEDDECCEGFSIYSYSLYVGESSIRFWIIGYILQLSPSRLPQSAQ